MSVKLRHRMLLLLAVALVLPGRLLCFAAADGAVVFAPGRVEIVIASNAVSVVRFAAEEARQCLERALGRPVPISTVDGTATLPADGIARLVLGATPWAASVGVTTNGLVRDAFRIRADPAANRVYVLGIDEANDARRAIDTGGIWRQLWQRGTLYGTYEFLERFFGVRFYFPGELGTCVPRLAAVSVPAGEHGSAPVYTTRRYAFYSGQDVYFEGDEPTRLRHPMKTLQMWRNRMETKTVDACHGMNKFRYMDRFAESHPEYFALLPDGRRHNSPEITSPGHPGQLCHTSGIWEEIYQDVRSYLLGEPASVRGVPADPAYTKRLKPDDSRRWAWGSNCRDGIVDVMAQDGMIKCSCPACRAEYAKAPEIGWASPLFWSQVCKIARRLKDEGISGYVSNLAYSKYRPVPPCDIPDNVIVGVAERGAWCLRDKPEFDRERNEIRAWVDKLGGRTVWLWTYCGKFGPLAIPGSVPMTPRVIGKYWQMMAPWIYGGFEQTRADRFLHNYLNCYVFGRVCWNPSVDVDTIIDEHHEKMFGPAAAEMKAFYDALEDLWMDRIAGETIDTPLGPQSRSPSPHELFTSIYSEKWCGESERFFNAAFGKVAKGSLEQRRIELVKRELFDYVAVKARDYRAMIDPANDAKNDVAGAMDLVTDGKFAASAMLPLNRWFGKWFCGRNRAAVDLDQSITFSAPASIRLSSKTGEVVTVVQYFKDAGGNPALVPGRRYRLSYLMKLADVKPVRFGGGAGTILWDDRHNYFPAGAISGTTDWMFQSFKFTAGPNVLTQKNPRNYLYLYMSGATGTVWFDNVRLMEEDEEKCGNAGKSDTGSVHPVVGSGEDDTRIPGPAVALEPNRLYALRCRVRHAAGGKHAEGVAAVIPGDCTLYHKFATRGWETIEQVFMTAADVDSKPKPVMLRQWHLEGKTEFKDVEAVPAFAEYAKAGGQELGYGEWIDGTEYHFSSEFQSRATVHSRALERFTKLRIGDGAVTFNHGSELVYRHRLDGRELLSGRIAVICPADGAVEVAVEVGTVLSNMSELGRFSKTGHYVFAVPASLLPAGELLVRIRGVSGRGYVKIKQYGFDAKVSGKGVFALGSTKFTADGRPVDELKPLDYLSDTSSGEQLRACEHSDIQTFPLSVWSQSSTRKVFRGRPMPTVTKSSFRLSAARNEPEAKQLVLNSPVPLKGVRLSAEVEDADIEIGIVGYLAIDYTADTAGARGMWPDPIFAQTEKGVDLEPGVNQPFWIRVKPRKDARRGIRSGKIVIQTFEQPTVQTLAVPLELEIFDFDFPDAVTCETAFGLDRKRVERYHRLTNDGDRKAVYEKYLEFYAKHHLCPYQIDAYTFSPMRSVKWRDGFPVFDWKTWDAEIERVRAKYHFNAFKISLAGVGGGGRSGPSRKKRMLNGAEIGSHEFELYFERYIKAVEDHLIEKGWIDMTYVYIFDEPRPGHYGYIRETLQRMKKYAPRIRRMVTAQPMVELDGVNLWCPITYKYDRAKCDEARAKGEQVWWYVTFSSKMPHVNEHVEHSGVDNRVWLWQTWAERICGILIWQVNSWNRDRIYGDRLQNPFEDTVCWGGKGPWNSGEGRYLYPPITCFDGASSPILESPVDSIRFEMLREGVEDFEYFVLLKKLDPENALLKVPAAVSASKTEYSYDPAALEAHRLKLAREIERLR